MKHDQERDQALLLLAVGELSGFGKTATELHLLLCRRCRARMGELQDASRQIAASIAGTGAAHAALPTLAQIKLKFAAYAAALVVLAGVAAGAAIEHESSVRPAPTAILHCLPGIPSDRCR